MKKIKKKYIPPTIFSLANFQANLFKGCFAGNAPFAGSDCSEGSCPKGCMAGDNPYG